MYRKLTLLAMLVFFLSACSAETVSVEVTRLVTELSEVEVTVPVDITRLVEVEVTRQVEVTRLVEVEIPVTVTPTNTPIPEPTPTTDPEIAQTMTRYESVQFPFAIEYPTGWTEDPKEEGFTVSYSSDDLAATFAIAEEDLAEFGAEAMSLEDYVDLVLFGAGVDSGEFELLSRSRTTNAQGLPVQILELSGGPNGSFRITRFVYLHDNRIGFSASYIAFSGRHEQLQPAIAYSFSTFEVTE